MSDSMFKAMLRGYSVAHMRATLASVEATNNDPSMIADVTAEIERRFAKACPICKAAPTGRCLEKVKDGHQYLAEPHPERYAEEEVR